MKNIALVSALLGSAVMAPTTVSAATLLDIVNVPAQTNTFYGLTFTANASTSTVSFAGYQVPGNFQILSFGLFLNNMGSSIISTNGADFTLTRAGSGSNAFGGNGILVFQGTTAGSYDTLSQVANTIAGSNYTLRFNLSNSILNQPSGLRVEASNATVGAVPEPATWAMMMVGFGMVGGAARYRRRHSTVRYA
ncbi:PEPxxWA-CTERM sorting domain-containing protein [Sphingomonas sp. Leaf339]|uniref:PEPxxWA-CTERM sorting domain-containing protein n=1 Tax=Sphingomonas sp. Leaf339 TaxID=1736343 RepID=UPI0009E8F5D2|nr:PEPxxWA-CTERM sorting domain-containing protein [Sphingomonas sp. Leaf339]